MRVRQRLVLTCQRCGRHLSNHKARVDPAVTHRERWQLGHVFIHHQRDTALGQRADFGNRQRDIIRRHRHRLGVEVAAGDHLVFWANTSGLSDTALAFYQQHLRRPRSCVRHAPITCGWQRREYGSCTFSQLWCESAISLVSVST